MFGSESKSRVDSTTIDQTNTIAGYGEGDISNFSSGVDLSTGKNSTVNLTQVSSDQGAIAVAQNIALGQIEFQEGMFSTTAQLLDQTLGTAFGFLNDANKRTIETVAGQSAATVSAVERANRGESTEQARLLIIGGAVVTGLVAIVMMVRAFK